MRAVLLGICAVAIVGCGSKPTSVELDTHFSKKVSPQAEAKIVRLFQPAGPLVWGPIQRNSIFREGHALGVPISTNTGSELWRDATVGKLTYRVSAKYNGPTPDLVTISVSDGTEYSESEKPEKVVAAFKVDPGLIAAYKGASGFVRYGGEEFMLAPELVGSEQDTYLSCSYEFKP